MAGFNEIQAGRYNRALQKLLSMKGPASVNELSSLVYPSFSLFWGNEMRYLEQWALFGQAFSLLAVAANNSVIRIRNGTTNVIAVFTLLWLTNNQATNAEFHVEGPTPATSANDLATNVSAFITRFDKRGPQATTMTVTQDNTAPHANLGNTIVLAQIVAAANWNVIGDEIQEIPLLPGDALSIRAPVVNTAIAATVWWRERAMEDSELT